MHTVFFDRGDHFEVIADYSGSPRHAALSEADWKNEYESNSSYLSMRQSHAGSTAGITPQSVGRWEKDWSEKYASDQNSIKVISNGSLDFDGIPAVDADGVSKHIVTIKKVDKKKNDISVGAEQIRVTLSHPVQVSQSKPTLNKGSITFEVGPVDKPCDLTINAADPTGALKKGILTLRFK